MKIAYRWCKDGILEKEEQRRPVNQPIKASGLIQPESSIGWRLIQ